MPHCHFFMFRLAMHEASLNSDTQFVVSFEVVHWWCHLVSSDTISHSHKVPFQGENEAWQQGGKVKLTIHSFGHGQGVCYESERIWAIMITARGGLQTVIRLPMLWFCSNSSNLQHTHTAIITYLTQLLLWTVKGSYGPLLRSHAL